MWPNYPFREEMNVFDHHVALHRRAVLNPQSRLLGNSKAFSELKNWNGKKMLSEIQLSNY
jgi:hypothetical protein